MEAPGHEEIEKDLAEFLEGLFKAAAEKEA